MLSIQQTQLCRRVTPLQKSSRTLPQTFPDCSWHVVRHTRQLPQSNLGLLWKVAGVNREKKPRKSCCPWDVHDYGVTHRPAPNQGPCVEHVGISLGSGSLSRVLSCAAAFFAPSSTLRGSEREAARSREKACTSTAFSLFFSKRKLAHQFRICCGFDGRVQWQVISSCSRAAVATPTGFSAGDTHTCKYAGEKASTLI